MGIPVVAAIWDLSLAASLTSPVVANTTPPCKQYSCPFPYSASMPRLRKVSSFVPKKRKKLAVHESQSMDEER